MTVINPREWTSPTPPGGHDMPSPFHGDRLKTPRTERGWPQAELADIRIGYLVIDTVPRRALHTHENALADQLADFTTLDPDDQAALLKVLDALVTKTKLRALTTGAG